MKKNHQLILKINFQTDEEISNFEVAKKEMFRKIKQEFDFSLVDDGVIESGYTIEEVIN